MMTPEELAAFEASIRERQERLLPTNPKGAALDPRKAMRANLLERARDARRDGVSREEAGERARAFNVGDGRLADEEVGKLVDTVYREQGDRRNGLAPAPAPRPTPKRAQLPEPYCPFPVEALPDPLGAYVRQGALALGCDVAYLALPALAVVAGMIGYTRVLRLKRTWHVPSVLWTLVVADSGSLKTPAFRLSTDYLFRLQKRLDLEYKRKMAEYTEAMHKWDAAAKAAKKGKGDPPGDEPEPPVQQTLFTSNATIEAIAELIGDNPRGLLVACDELASWLGSFCRYKAKGAGTDLPHWLSMHSAGGFAYHRKTGDRRRIVLPHAAVSIAGGIQPGTLARALVGEFLDAGLVGRLNMALPPRPAKVWTETEIDPHTENLYHDLLEALHCLEFDRRRGEELPHVLKLSAEAKAAWVAWYNGWAQEQAAVEGELAAAFSKLEEAAARLALLHHVVTRVARGGDDLVPVEAPSVEAGATLARWFAREARRVYATLAETEQDRNTRRLVEFIAGRGGSITARALQNSNSRKFPSVEVAEGTLCALVEAGLGVWVEKPTTERGGHPTRAFRLHPTPDTTDTTPGGGDEDGDEPPAQATDTTPDTTPPATGFPQEKEGSVGSVGRRTDAKTPEKGPVAAETGGGGCVGRGEVVSDDTGNTVAPRKRRRGRL
jgi:hypothetical protein